jgi:hypothetical protein
VTLTSAHFLVSLQLAPVDITAMIFFFWYFVRYAAFIPIGYTVVLVLFVSLIGRLMVNLRYAGSDEDETLLFSTQLNFRRKIVEVTDERIKLMSEIIKSMRIVKMYCWEAAFERNIRLIRKYEC